MDLDGKVAIITGASSGIGLETARLLASKGVKLVLHGRREERLDALVKELGHAVSLAGDLAEPAAVASLLALAQTTYGRIDIAINNAGLNHTGTIEEIDIDQVCEMARVNVEANFRFIYTVLKYFRQTGSGHLINTTSIMGSKVRETAGAYAGTKHAVEALSEALRIELAKTKVKISCIAPGLVLTELHRSNEVHPSVLRKIDRPLKARDVAQMMLFVLGQPDHVNIPHLLILPQDHGI